MKVWIPEYYRAFRCIASACPDSCCKEWEVDVDDSAAVFYRSLPGALGDALRAVLRDTEDGTLMTIQDGRCPMWRQDGLCRIQAELGHEALCQVCREFPRLRHDYGNFTEYGLELSCPEAARLILTLPHTITVEEVPGEEQPDYDMEAMSILLESRKAALDFLDSAQLPVNQILTVLLLYAHEVQSWLDGGTPAAIDVKSSLALAKKHAGEGDWNTILDVFRDLEILTPQWRARLAAPSGGSHWHSGYLALTKYFIGRYWLQAVSDFDLICRVKLMVTAALLIFHLGGDFIETAQLFSKEIENDPDNLDALLDGMYTSPALTDIHLLSLLLTN